MASITKKNKLYFRTEKDVIRRLDKVAPQLYGLILSGFITGDLDKQYKELNKNVASWKEFKPINLIVPEDHKISFGLLQYAINPVKKTKIITISHNGSWRPLVRLKMAEPTIDSIIKSKSQKK